MRVIGTAGHVDHGKSALVLALTGIDPDRLSEEKERGLTIDLGFAWLTLPDGEPVGIVDVPGHRDFIENMLAGVGSIDTALFVIAADEGVMPQTREHLAILDLLEIGTGVVALTKVDLAESEAWIELVVEDVTETLAGTVLEDAPIVLTSARTGQGLDNLLSTLQKVLTQAQPRPDRGRPRLPIDRVFTISGFGTVVTGTLSDGCFEVGQAVEVLPSGREARIRGLQTHKQKVERAVPGSRVATSSPYPAGCALPCSQMCNCAICPMRGDRCVTTRNSSSLSEPPR
jgi:selenocysteine-specific elongation factor